MYNRAASSRSERAGALKRGGGKIDEFRLIEELFHAAMARPESERAAFLDERCTDPELRRKVEALLREGLPSGVLRELNPAADGTAVVVRKPGQSISHYRLKKKLGEGGMGEVWLAEDRALGRPAAIKLLRDDLSVALRARLRREAEASAKLQHPCIATFHESGEDGQVTWLAMEYVDGENLRSRLGRGALSPEEALPIAAGLLQALVHAHAAGVLHRDIKPENVMLTGPGKAKLLDFGLAKWIDLPREGDIADQPTVAAVTELTGHGVIAGTPGYMAPEQLRGDPVDARTDVFAVGAVVHEMLSGRAAFPGSSGQERLAAVLSRDPDPIAVPGVSPGLGAILTRAMKREATERYPDASSFLADLRRVGEGRAIADLPKTLAVLDLDNVSGDEDNDWIGTGIAETLATTLGGVPAMKVVPREKVMGLRSKLAASGADVDPLQVGRILGCRWVLAGSVQRAGPTIRVTTRVCETGAGEVIASEKTDGKLDDIFDLQDRLAAALARQLHLDVTTAGAAPEMDGFESYNRGRALLYRFGKGSMKEAGEHYERAVRADPDYVPALADLSMMHALTFSFTLDPRELKVAEDYATRALRRDPENRVASIWRGYALWRQRRLEEALEQEGRATLLDRDEFLPPYFAACILLQMGRPADALPRAQESIARKPIAWAMGVLGWCHLATGNPSEAGWSFEQAVSLRASPDQPPFPIALALQAEFLRRRHELDAARETALANLEEIEQTDHIYRDVTRAVCLVVLGRIALDRGDTAAARASFDQAVAQMRGRPVGLGIGHTMVQALAGQTRAGGGAAPLDEALSLYERRDLDFSWLLSSSDEVTLSDLARAAASLGRVDQESELRQRARRAGLTPALEE